MAQCVASSKQSGKQCRLPAVAGATVCRFHGGAAPQVQRAAARRVALVEAQHTLERLGRLGEIDDVPRDMLALAGEAKRNVEAYRLLVSQLSPSVGPEGIAGRTGNEKIEHEAAAHVFVTMYDAERDRLFGYLERCRKLGIDEARLAQDQQLAEGQARQLVAVIRLLLDGIRAVLLAVGVAAELLSGVYEREVPGLVRQAIEVASSAAVEVT